MITDKEIDVATCLLEIIVIGPVLGTIIIETTEITKEEADQSIQISGVIIVVRLAIFLGTAKVEEMTDKILPMLITWIMEKSIMVLIMNMRMTFTNQKRICIHNRESHCILIQTTQYQRIEDL